MTIKQQGGIFGRNPTFNEVEAGDLTVRASVPTITIADTDTTGTHILKASNANLDVSADPSGVQAGSGIRFFVDGDEKVKINSTGNLVISNAGNGIDFSATSGTGTSELFDDYEEGTASPQATSASGTLTTVTQSGSYTKIGRAVNYSFIVTIDNVGSGSGTLNIVLPFVCSTSPIRPIGFGRENALTGNAVQIRTVSDGSANASCFNTGTLANGTQVLGTITYETV